MSVKQKIGCLMIVILAITLPISVFSYLLFRPAPVYETNDIADYGVIKGNYDNERPRAFVFSFFPEKIEEYFDDVTYHYKAIKGDTYAYEMGLEFVIQDADQYTSFLSSVIGNHTAKPFYFDSYYQAYYISDYFSLIEPSGDYPPYIDYAKVGLVLFAEEEQRIIFVALGMYDGGGANVEELNYFFDRFDIYPHSYAKRANPGIG